LLIPLPLEVHIDLEPFFAGGMRTHAELLRAPVPELDGALEVLRIVVHEQVLAFRFAANGVDEGKWTSW
jgi:hypothetical protein